MHVRQIEHGLWILALIRRVLVLRGGRLVVLLGAVATRESQNVPDVSHDASHSLVEIIAKLHTRRVKALGRRSIPVDQRASVLFVLTPVDIRQLPGHLIDEIGNVRLRHLVAQLGEIQILHERLLDVSLPIEIVRVDEHARPFATFGHVLEQFRCCRARSQHARTTGVHLTEIVIAERMSGLRRCLKPFDGHLVITFGALAIVVHDAEHELPFDVALIGRQLKVFERLVVALLDAGTVIVRHAHAGLAHGIGFLSRALEELQGSEIVLFDVVVLLRVELAEIGHCIGIAVLSCKTEVVQRLVEGRVAKVVQLPETVLDERARD